MAPITEQEVISHVGSSDPAAWERLVHHLIVDRAPHVGIRITDVSRDYRTTSPDGGIDIQIHTGASRDDIWLPREPSIWSVKSGEDGTKAPTLETELNPSKHPAILNHLKKGGAYCYVTARPMSPQNQNKLRAAADQFANAQGVSRESIRFYGIDQITVWLQNSPNVVASRFKEFAQRRGLSAELFSRDAHCDTSVSFIDFPSRRETCTRIRFHMLDCTQAEPLVHIAGLSGVGKTRLVLEATQSLRRESIDCLYFRGLESFEPLLRVLRDNVQQHARVIVDEISLDEFCELNRKLDGLGNRVRVITIGTANRDAASQRNLIIIPPPRPEDEIAQLLQKSIVPGTVPDALLAEIREHCAHDLRLALMLLREAQEQSAPKDTAALLALAVHPLSELFNRLLQHPSSDGNPDPDNFADRYRWLTLGATVGFRSPRNAELKFIAHRSGIGEQKLNDTVNWSELRGLGAKSGHLYSAIPRGLAAHVFSSRLWPSIRDQFGELFENAPSDDFRRSIMERIEDCKEIREEVQAESNRYFRSRLGEPLISALTSADITRTLRAWVEFSPSTGLEWLRTAISSASLDQLREFRGSSALGLGPQGPRREVVWLLENLSCFASHYQACEEMLFKLACAENEDVGNSATEVWKDKLRIYLSNSEVPFERRIEILLQRLTTADTSTAPLILTGLSAALSRPLSTLAPPRVIGGRLTPPEWRPGSEGVYPHFVNAIIGALAVLQRQSTDVQQISRDELTRNLGLYCKADTFVPLQEFLGASTQRDGRVTLVDALDRLLIQLRRQVGTDALIHASEAWRTELQPQSLMERIKLEYQRGIWGHTRAQDDNSEDWRTRFGSLADDLNSSPDVLNSLQDWLAERENECSFALGAMLATKENGDTFKPTLQAWMAHGRCRSILSGYFNELRRANEAFPDWAAHTIEELSQTKPALAAQLSADNDPSERGLACVKRCISANSVDKRAVLTQMATREWEQVLGAGGVAWLLGILWPATEERDPVDGLVALNLLDRFALSLTEGELPNEWLPIGQRLVEAPPPLSRVTSAYSWKQLAMRLARSRPEVVVKVASARALDFPRFKGEASAEAIEVLCGLASNHAELVVSTICNEVLRLPHRLTLSSEGWQQLFAAVDPSIPMALLQTHGVRLARELAEFIPDPSVNDSGVAHLHPLTESLLRDFGSDPECYRRFATARWNGRVFHGWAWEEPRRSQAERLVKAYSNHEIPALARWANDVESEHKAAEERERIEHAEDSRR
jgi:hypothetical protein